MNHSSDPAPLIPRQLLFGNPEKIAPQISPDGKKLAYIAPSQGVLNVFVQTIGENDDRVVSKSDSRPILNFAWAENGRQLVYAKDNGGDENFHLYLVDLASEIERDLTPFAGVTAAILGGEPAFPDTMVVQLNQRVPQLFDAYRLDLSSGEMTMAGENPGDVIGWLCDSQLQVRAAITMLPDGSSQVLVRPSESAPFRLLLSFPFGEEGAPLSFSSDGQKLIFLSDKGVNTSRLYEIDVDSGEMTLLHAREDADIAAVMLHPTRKTPEAVSYNRLRQEWVALDPEIEADLHALHSAIAGDVSVVSRDGDDKIWLVSCVRDDGPLAYYRYDRASQTASLLFSSRPDLENCALAAMKPLEITARDGLKLVCYLSLPVGEVSENLPMVLRVHGGPWARDAWGFSGEVQWLTNRGYAVLQVNFRGSTGFGKDFVSAADREWGGKMHDDLVDAVNWAVEAGIADPARIAIYGGSYGGYAVLTGLTKTPGLFVCGVDVVGVANLLTFMNTIPPYWEPMRPILKLRVGDPETDEEFLKARSPVFFADQIVRPLLIAQGANDPRVNQDESDQIVRAVRKNGKEVTYLLFPDEGHGFARPQNRLKFYAATEAFLAQHLGGRAEAAQAGEEPPLVAPGEEGAKVSNAAEAAPVAG